MPTPASKTIGNYFTNEVIIPEYQREFAWDDVLATQLFDSFDKFLISNPQIPGNAGDPNVGPNQVTSADINRFYLGTIITVDEAPIPIVDGQQRLTSIAIMASVLRDYCIDKGQYEQAHYLDRYFCWEPKTDTHNYQIYSNGSPKIKLRDTGDGDFNLLQNMYHICSLNISPDPPIVYEITNIGTTGSIRNIRIDANLKWRLLKNHELQIDSTEEIISLARTAEFADDSFKVTAADSALINVGETFQLRYGKRKGNAPKGSTNIGKARIKLIEKIKHTLDTHFTGTGAGPAPHLPDLETYVAQWLELIIYTEVTQIQFEDAGSAMKHFLVVNDKTLEKDLTDLDRLRAQIKIVTEGDCQTIPAASTIPEPDGYTAAQLARMKDEEKLNICIQQDFETVEEILLNRRQKKSIWSEDFFYDFAQVYWPLKELDGNPRNANVMPEIKRQYLNNMQDSNGQWDKLKFSEFSKEIRAFAGIYCRARDRWSASRPPGTAVSYLSDVSKSDPFEPEICERIEEVLIRTLANMGSRKQFRPTYMAGSYVIRRAIDAGKITENQYTILSEILCRSLLKMHIALQILPKGAGQPEKTSGEIYAYSDKFVPKITNLAAGSTFTNIKNVFNEIQTDINAEVDSYPPEAPGGTRLPISLDNPSAKPILMLAEWQAKAGPGAIVAGSTVAGAAGADTASTHFHDGAKNYSNEVEHIQPKKLPRAWPRIPRRRRRGAPTPNVDGYTAPNESTWEENKDRLGNRLLCKRDVNTHVSNHPLKWKISNIGLPGPVCPKDPIPPPPAQPNYKDCNGTSKHYKGDDREIVKKWLKAHGAGGWLTSARTPAIATEPLVWGKDEIEKWEKEILELLITILP